MNVANVALFQFPFQRFNRWRVASDELVAVEEEVALAIVHMPLDGVVHEHGEELIVYEPSVVIPQQMLSPFFHRPFPALHVIQVSNSSRKQPRVRIYENLLC